MTRPMRRSWSLQCSRLGCGFAISRRRIAAQVPPFAWNSNPHVPLGGLKLPVALVTPFVLGLLLLRLWFIPHTYLQLGLGVVFLPYSAGLPGAPVQSDLARRQELGCNYAE